jgi:undecaprenyl-diphosphatase
MNYLNSIILGLIQGFTEFLPISSSGHLVLAQHLLGLDGPQLAFDILLHIGTLIAVLIFYRHDITEMLISALSRTGHREGRHWLWMLIIATIPTAIIGFAFKDVFEKQFGDPHAVAWQLLITAIILFIADRMMVQRRPSGKVTWFSAILVGIAQGIAIIPGISRSGATIATGVYTGMDGKTAAKFSFLLSIPAIIGAVVLEAKDISGINSADILPTLLGVLAAFVAGYLSIGFLIGLLGKRRLWIFGVYLVIVWLLAMVF